MFSPLFGMQNSPPSTPRRMSNSLPASRERSPGAQRRLEADMGHPHTDFGTQIHRAMDHNKTRTSADPPKNPFSYKKLVEIACKQMKRT